MLDAAVQVIEEFGVEAGVQQIADRAGFVRSVVYRLFSGRHDLDRALRRHINEMVMAELTPTLLPEGTVRHTVERSCMTYVRWVAAHPRLHEFLGSTTRTSGVRMDRSKTAVALQLSQLFALALKQFGQDTSITDPTAFGLVAMVDGVVNRWLSTPGSPLSVDDIAVLVADIIWNVLSGYLRSVGVDPTVDVTFVDLMNWSAEGDGAPSGVV